MKRFLVAVGLVGVTHLHTPTAAAQNASRGSLDLDATVGTSHGGIYSMRVTVGLDLLGALRLRELSSGAWIAAAGAGIQAIGNGNKILPVTVTGTGHTPEFPSLTSWTALVGWESGRAGQASLRLLVGPTLYSGDGSSTLGATVRADIATPTRFHFALTATGRGSLVSGFPGGATSLWAAGIGVRLR